MYSPLYPPPPPAADHPNQPSLPVSSKMTPTLFYEMENINTSGEAFNEQELLYFVVLLIYRTRETFGSLTVI